MARGEIVYLLDTHTWIWWNSKPENLSQNVRNILSDSRASKSLLLSAISIWEFSKLVEKGRLTLAIDGANWIEQALSMDGLEVIGLTPEIMWNSCNLPGKFHDDPADQLIVATARATQATLLSKDRLIHAYPHVLKAW